MLFRSAIELQEVSLEFEQALRKIAENNDEENASEQAALVVEHYSVLIENKLAQLDSSLTQLNTLFAKPKKSATSSSEIEVNREGLLEILAQLKNMSEAFDPMAEEFWFENKNAFQGHDVDEEITRMENHLRNYNFERVADFIGRIERMLKEVAV